MRTDRQEATAREAEEAVLGALLIDSSRFRDVDGLISPEHFTSDARMAICRVIAEAARSNELADVVTVSTALPETQDYCFDLIKSTPGTAMLIPWAGIVRENWRLRQAIMIATNLMANCRDRDGQAIDGAVRDLMALDVDSFDHEHTTRSALESAWRQIHTAHDSGGALAGLTSGLQPLDDALGGFHASDLVVVAARPAMGKTGFLLGATEAGSRQGPVGLISGEQPHDQVGMRWVAAGSGISLHRLRAGRLYNDNEWARASKAVQEYSLLPIHISDAAAPDLTDVERIARKWRHKHGIKGLYVDYLQRIQVSSMRKAPRHERVGEVAMRLKNLARDLEIPVIALAQLDREADKDERPKMHHLANSSEIEKESDQIILPWRDLSNPKAVIAKAEMNVVKNRHGMIGTIHCRWHGASTSFVSKERGDQLEAEYEERKRGREAMS